VESCDFDPLAFVIKYRVLTLDIGIKPLNYSNLLDPEMLGYITKKGELVVIKDHVAFSIVTDSKKHSSEQHSTG